MGEMYSLKITGEGFEVDKTISEELTRRIMNIILVYEDQERNNSI